MENKDAQKVAFSRILAGDEEEKKCRAEMAEWSEDQLIAKSAKEPGLAPDIAARQILEERRRILEKKRFSTGMFIGIAGVLFSALAAWLAWKALPQAVEPQPVPAAPAVNKPHGADKPAN